VNCSPTCILALWRYLTSQMSMMIAIVAMLHVSKKGVIPDET